MKVVYPLKTQEAEPYYNNNEAGDSGFYPVGANNFWHGGVHLYSSNPVGAVADGKVIAYRISEGFFIDPLPYEKDLTHSNNFVLIQHTYETPKEEKIEFYSLYMHLLPWRKYILKILGGGDIPHFFESKKFTVNTEEDGEGLKMFSADQSLDGDPECVIPRDSVVKALPTSQPGDDHWSKLPENEGYVHVISEHGHVGFCMLTDTYVTEQDGVYFIKNGLNIRSFADKGTKLGLGRVKLYPITEYSPYKVDAGHWSNLKENWQYCFVDSLGDHKGFIKLAGRGTSVGNNSFIINRKSSGDTWDPPLPETGGINVRKGGSGGEVIKVLPKDSLVHFKNGKAFNEAPNKSAYFKIKGHGEEAQIYGGSIKVETEHTPTFDSVVLNEGEEDWSIKAGQVVGYPGKYGWGNDMFHLEIFAPSLAFFENPKGDETESIYLIPKDTEFKEKAPKVVAKASLTLAAHTVLKRVPSDNCANEDDYRKVQKQDLKAAEEVWFDRSKLPCEYVSPYYILTSDYSKFYNSKELSVSAGQDLKKGTYIKFVAQEEGSVRQGEIQEKEAKDEYWFKKSDLEGKYKYVGIQEDGNITEGLYNLTADVSDFYSEDPTLVIVKDNASLKLSEDLEGTVEIQEDFTIDDVVWVAITLPNGKAGCIEKTALDGFKANYYEWEKFFNKEEEAAYEPENATCDIAALIDLIENNPKNPPPDGILTPEEIKNSVTDPDVGPDLQKIVCKHPTEWSKALDEETKKYDCLLETPFLLSSDYLNDNVLPHVNNLQWWDDVFPDEPDSKSLWFFSSY